MPSNRISLKGGFLSLERTPGVADEYAMTIHLTHTQLAELFGPVIDVKSLTLEAQRSRKKAQERAEKARKQAFEDQIAKTVSLGRQFDEATRAYVEDGLTDNEAVSLVAHEMFVTQDELRRCRLFARKHDRRERDDKIFKLYKAGKSNAQIAKKFDLHPVSVARLIGTLKRRKAQEGGAK